MTIILCVLAFVAGFVVGKNPDKVSALISKIKDRFKKPVDPVVVPPATPVAPPPENVVVATPSEPQGRFGPFPPELNSSFGPKPPTQ